MTLKEKVEKLVEFINRIDKNNNDGLARAINNEEYGTASEHKAKRYSLWCVKNKMRELGIKGLNFDGQS
jgi:hypothetical protein